MVESEVIKVFLPKIDPVNTKLGIGKRGESSFVKKPSTHRLFLVQLLTARSKNLQRRAGSGDLQCARPLDEVAMDARSQRLEW